MTNEVTEQDVTECIEGVFNELPGLRESCVNTKFGPALQVEVDSSIGKIMGLYHLRPVAHFLLQKYIQDRSRLTAKSTLALIIGNLPLAIRIALDNTLDAAEQQSIETWETIASVMGTQARPYDAGAIDKRRRETLDRMNGRNTALIDEPTGGRKKIVTVNRIVAAVGRLVTEGKHTIEQITVTHVADRLGCKEGAIYKALEREDEALKREGILIGKDGLNFKELLNRWKLDNQAE